MLEQAEDAWRAERRLDYNRPIENQSSRAATLFLAACHKGHARSCWLAMTLGPPEHFDEAAAMVRSNCQNGDGLSCRALPERVRDQDDLDKRDERCYLDCDEQRARTLIEGCRAGLYVECVTLKNWGRLVEGMREHAPLATREMCRLAISGCYDLADVQWTLGDIDGYRDSNELICQRTGRCDFLADIYRWRRVREPFPGRKDVLIAWTCKHDRFYRMTTLCGGPYPPSAGP